MVARDNQEQIVMESEGKVSHKSCAIRLAEPNGGLGRKIIERPNTLAHFHL